MKKIIKKHLNSNDSRFEAEMFSTASEKDMINDIKQRVDEGDSMTFLTRPLQEKVAKNKNQKDFIGNESILKEKLQKLGLGSGMAGFNSREMSINKKLLPEEAVMRLVENIDSNVVRAEAMQLTKVGFIDCLREVNRQKIFTVKKVKDDFKRRIDMVEEAKKYELRC